MFDTWFWEGVRLKSTNHKYVTALFRMTKELRESLVKVAKAAAEKCKVGVRKARQKAMADLKKKPDVTKDSVRRLEKHVSFYIPVQSCYVHAYLY